MSTAGIIMIAAGALFLIWIYGPNRAKASG